MTLKAINMKIFKRSDLPLKNWEDGIKKKKKNEIKNSIYRKDTNFIWITFN